MLRHMCQGLASHASITSTVKHFRSDRGKAVAIVSLGFPAGRAVLPVMWAAFGGTKHIGSICSMAATISVFASALGLSALGWMIDAGIRLESMVIGTVIYIAIASGPIWLACAAQLRRRDWGARYDVLTLPSPLSGMRRNAAVERA